MEAQPKPGPGRDDRLFDDAERVTAAKPFTSRRRAKTVTRKASKLAEEDRVRVLEAQGSANKAA